MAIRGNSPQFTQWRMEGVEIPNPTHYADMTGLGRGLLTGLSAHGMGNSDFFHSAFPAEYSNALASVFDMTMRTGNNQRYEHTFQADVWGLDVASEGPIVRNRTADLILTSYLNRKFNAKHTNRSGVTVTRLSVIISTSNGATK